MNRVFEKRVVPAAVVEDADTALRLSEAMLAGGMDIIEITFRTDGAIRAIQAVCEKFPEMLVGAGTVLSREQFDRAVDAGIRFAVAPGLNPALIEATGDSGVPFIPGVVTPSEIENAMALGLDLLKFFPAEAMGGAVTLKALSGPYGHTGVRFLPTGGISMANAANYLDLDVVAAVGGSWMIASSLIKKNEWDDITRLCREALTLSSE